MPDLVNLAERYHLLGVQTQDRENNADLDGRADQHVEPQVVYTTESLEEAKAICREGGWIQDGQFVAVSGYRDTQRVPDLAEGKPSPLRKMPHSTPHNVDQLR